MKSFDGAHIWIVGASSGIGRALAVELSARGATLALSARRAAELEALNAELGGRHAIFAVDVSDMAALDQTADMVFSSFPRLDSVVYMAALYRPAPLGGMDIVAAHEMIAVNFTGALNLVHAVLPSFLNRKGGQIALCGSVAGYRGLPNGQPYSATKAAVMSLAQSLRAEEAANGIDVKLISPGFVRTPMTGKNDFAMPMMIEPDEAARHIADGLLRPAFEIHFPRRFTRLMKLVAILPDPLYFRLAAKLARGKGQTS